MLAPHYFFQPIASCFRMASPPTIDGDFSEWPRRHELPDWLPDERNQPFATVYTAWDEEHLYLAVEANLRREPRVKPSRFWEGDCLEVFLDLRGTLARDVYTEHCYHFFFLPEGIGNRTPKGGLCEPGVANQVAIAEYEALIVGGQTYAQGYRLEIALSREAIPAFEPIPHPRIGFNYVLHDASGRSQWWSAGRELSTFRDPSTWGILELMP